VASPLSVFASSNSADGALAGWADPTYAYNDDGVQFATRVGTAKNTWYGTLFGFDLSSIPDNATIVSVILSAEWKNSSTDTNGPVLYLGAKSGGSEIGTANTDATGQTTFEVLSHSVTGLITSELKATGSSGFWAILRFRRTDNIAHTASVDYVKCVVEYTTPPPLDELIGANLDAGTPVLGVPTISQIHVLSIDTFILGIPIVDSADIGQIHVLLGSNLDTGVPILDSAAIEQVHILSSTDITAGIPAFTTPTISQVHVLQGVNINAGTPAFTETLIGQTHQLLSNSIITSVPEFTETTIAQVHILSGQEISAGTLILGAPTLLETQGTDELIGSDLFTGNPVLDATNISQIHVLQGNTIEIGNPLFTETSISQIHLLISESVFTSNSVLGTPTIGEAGTDELIAGDLFVPFVILNLPLLETESSSESSSESSVAVQGKLHMSPCEKCVLRNSLLCGNPLICSYATDRVY